MVPEWGRGGAAGSRALVGPRPEETRVEVGGETAEGVGIEARERVALDVAQLEPLGCEGLQGPPLEAA